MLKVGAQSCGFYRDDDPVGSLEYIKARGFQSVDFNIDLKMPVGRLVKQKTGPFESFFSKSTEEILDFYRPLKDAVEQTGVTVDQMHAPFPSYIPGYDELNEYLFEGVVKSMAVCQLIGCPAIVVHPTQRSTFEKEWDTNLANYRRLIPYAKQYGVKVCLENIFNNRGGRMVEGRLSNAADACRLIDLLNEEAGGDYFGFCFDIGHANLTNRNVKEFVKTLGHRLTILHIHDNNGRDDLHMVPYSYLATPNLHSIDWQGFVEGLKEIGYKGVLGFEICRIWLAYPKAVHDLVLNLVAGIGKYWAECIDDPNWPAQK